MSSSENESINSTESESDQEGIEEMDNLLQDLAPYQFEPEETSDENESSECEDDSDEDEEEDIQEERRGILTGASVALANGNYGALILYAVPKWQLSMRKNSKGRNALLRRKNLDYSAAIRQF